MDGGGIPGAPGGGTLGIMGSMGGRRSACGLPHMSLQRCPRTISLCAISSAARSAAARDSNVTNAQWRCPRICACQKIQVGCCPRFSPAQHYRKAAILRVA